jgi:hypothetical protein
MFYNHIAHIVRLPLSMSCLLKLIFGNVLFDPHPMQDYANVARQADLDSLSHIVEGAAADVSVQGRQRSGSLQ